MPTSYYIDSTAAYETNAANNGTASGTPWGGVGGVQRALGLVVAGDSIYIKGGADIAVEKLVKITHDNAHSAGTIAVGDLVYEYTDSDANDIPDTKGDAEGYVVWKQSATVYWVHVTTGTWTTGATSFISQASNPTTVYVGHMTATATPGCLTGASGATGNLISVVGVNASWTEDGTLGTLDGNDAAANCLTGAHNYYNWRNIEFKSATGSNVIFTAGIEWPWINCISHNAGTSGNTKHGFDFTNSSRQYLDTCQAYSNFGSGFYNLTLAHLDHCNAYSNVMRGFYSNGANSFWSCIARTNSFEGFRLYYEDAMRQCASDGNLTAWGHGVTVNGFSGLVSGCRITNNVGTGLFVATGVAIDQDNFYLGNAAATGGSGNYVILSTRKGASTQVTSGTAGYQAQASGKLMLVPGATALRKTVAIDANNNAAFSSGLPTQLLFPVGDAHV